MSNDLEIPDENKIIIPQEKLYRLKERKELLKQQNWIVDQIFEKGEIHQLCGPSGVGKSTWFYQFMNDVENRRKIFGLFDSHPEPYAYIVCDRSFLLTAMTLDRIGLGDWDLPVFTIDELRREIGRKELTLGDVADMLPWAKILYIDAIGWFEPAKSTKGMGYTQAMNYWSEIRDRVTSKGKTVIATGHSPKAKGNERYGNPRDRVMGTVGTVGSIATVINFEFQEEGDIRDPYRILNIAPRNSPGMVLKYKLGLNGKFEYADAFDGKEGEKEKAVYAVVRELDKIKIDIVNPETIKAIMEKTGISRATMTRALAELVDAGVLKMIRRGYYQVVGSTNLTIV